MADSSDRAKRLQTMIEDTICLMCRGVCTKDDEVAIDSLTVVTIGEKLIKIVINKKIGEKVPNKVEKESPESKTKPGITIKKEKPDTYPNYGNAGPMMQPKGMQNARGFNPRTPYQPRGPRMPYNQDQMSRVVPQIPRPGRVRLMTHQGTRMAPNTPRMPAPRRRRGGRIHPPQFSQPRMPEPPVQPATEVSTPEAAETSVNVNGVATTDPSRAQTEESNDVKSECGNTLKTEAQVKVDLKSPPTLSPSHAEAPDQSALQANIQAMAQNPAALLAQTTGQQLRPSPKTQSPVTRSPFLSPVRMDEATGQVIPTTTEAQPIHSKPAQASEQQRAEGVSQVRNALDIIMSINPTETVEDIPPAIDFMGDEMPARDGWNEDESQLNLHLDTETEETEPNTSCVTQVSQPPMRITPTMLSSNTSGTLSLPPISTFTQRMAQPVLPEAPGDYGTSSAYRPSAFVDNNLQPSFPTNNAWPTFPANNSQPTLETYRPQPTFQPFRQQPVFPEGTPVSKKKGRTRKKKVDAMDDADGLPGKKRNVDQMSSASKKKTRDDEDWIGPPTPSTSKRRSSRVRVPRQIINYDEFDLDGEDDLTTANNKSGSTSPDMYSPEENENDEDTEQDEPDMDKFTEVKNVSVTLEKLDMELAGGKTAYLAGK